MEFSEPPVAFCLPYDGKRLEWAIEIIGWSKNQAAARMMMAEGSFRQMLGNKRLIPDIMGIWFETLAQMHMTFPKPMGWNEKPSPEEAEERLRRQQSLRGSPESRAAKTNLQQGVQHGTLPNRNNH
jgi:hypothetical protein